MCLMNIGLQHNNLERNLTTLTVTLGRKIVLFTNKYKMKQYDKWKKSRFIPALPVTVVHTHGNLYVLATCLGIWSLQVLDVVMSSKLGGGGWGVGGILVQGSLGVKVNRSMDGYR